MKKTKIQTTPIFSKVEKAKKDGYSIVSAQGSSRSSKTYNILIWLINYAAQHRNTSVSVVRSTLPAIRGSVLRDFKEIMQKMNMWDDKRYSKTEFIYTLANGSYFEFFSCDHEQKLRGRKRKILYVNEANELKFLEWQQLKMRTTEFTIIDYNPSFSDDHWICDINKDSRCHHFISTYKDNPFLEKIVIEEIESLRLKNKSLWTIYGLGLQAIIEGVIFKNVEVVDDIPAWVKKRWVGLDFGYTNDPTAGVEVALHDNDLYIDELFYRTMMLAKHITSELEEYRDYKIISESADPRLVDEIYNSGINIFPVEKFPGSIMAGINKMLEFNIKVTRRSVNVIKEFRNYTYMQDKDEKWLNMAIDDYNHAIDAARYVVLTEILGHNHKPINEEQLLEDFH